MHAGIRPGTGKPHQESGLGMLGQPPGQSLTRVRRVHRIKPPLPLGLGDEGDGGLGLRIGPSPPARIAQQRQAGSLETIQRCDNGWSQRLDIRNDQRDRWRNGGQ